MDNICIIEPPACFSTVSPEADDGQGGRPPYNPVMMFKIFVIHAASDDRTKFLINDLLSLIFAAVAVPGFADAKRIRRRPERGGRRHCH